MGPGQHSGRLLRGALVSGAKAGMYGWLEQ